MGAHNTKMLLVMYAPSLVLDVNSPTKYQSSFT